MSNKEQQEENKRLHIRNKNCEQYDLEALKMAIPKLADYIKPNEYGYDSVDFASPIAVRLLNKAILKHYYGIHYWEFPKENLSPPIPGRADYIHFMADLLAENNLGIIPTGDKITCLDIGVGASCIYPIIGVTEYDWKFIGSDVDSKSLQSAKKIANENPALKEKLEFRLQTSKTNIFNGIINHTEKIDVAICNPPYHASSKEAQRGAQKKVSNLTGVNTENPILNFAGIRNELITEGGEYNFVISMIYESRKYAKNFFWFSTLVSKESNLLGIYKTFEKFEVPHVKTIPIETGNKFGRIIAWSFLTEEEQKEWRTKRWNH
ncbi:MAG TPA: 23S rRNA (adenine(1618)-N(6))-methyltransferase RlmF [Chitinophagales bacterium]|nr:23S rRNA (adenine(1618)-N(6))-methyltransferase RlmF [Chitinophagales bacterium]